MNRLLRTSNAFRNANRITSHASRSIPDRSFSSSTSRLQDSHSHHSQSQPQSHSQSSSQSDSSSSRSSFFNSTGWETAMGASAGVLLLGFAAMLYQEGYKSRVLSKMEAAFDPGYDPVLSLNKSGDAIAHIKVNPPREEEELIESIVRGKEEGRYFLILGSKGSGKSSLIIEKISEADADGCAYFEAHGDPAIVVDRFSEAINYSMNRDYLGALVGLNDLSGMTSFQALERGLHKLEKALIRRRSRTGRPVVIVMNSAHLLPRDEEGIKLLHLFQQRAERWAAAGTCTMVITSNDYWVFDSLRKQSSRMDILTFEDLTRPQAFSVLKGCRQKYYNEDPENQDEELLDEIYRTTGGRISLLNRVARRRNMRKATRQLVEDDVNWLLSKTGIIEDHDDDVMDEQKWSTCSWLLFVELAKRQAALEAEMESDSEFFTSPSEDQSYSTSQDLSLIKSTSEKKEDGEEGPTSGESILTDPTHVHKGSHKDVPNPSLTWGEARQVMTRPDFITELDHLNIIQIDRHHMIKADSMPLLRAFRKVAEQDGYEDKLELVMDRVSAIESLLRTRELVWKEQGEKGKIMIKQDGKGREIESWTLLGGDERLGREVEGEEE